MKEIKVNKANDLAAIERRRQKQAAQNHSCGEVNEQIFSEVANKDTFGPPTLTYFTGKGNRGNNRLAPLDAEGASR